MSTKGLNHIVSQSFDGLEHINNIAMALHLRPVSFGTGLTGHRALVFRYHH